MQYNEYEKVVMEDRRDKEIERKKAEHELEELRACTKVIWAAAQETCSNDFALPCSLVLFPTPVTVTSEGKMDSLHTVKTYT